MFYLCRKLHLTNVTESKNFDEVYCEGCRKSIHKSKMYKFGPNSKGDYYLRRESRPKYYNMRRKNQADYNVKKRLSMRKLRELHTTALMDVVG